MALLSGLVALHPSLFSVLTPTHTHVHALENKHTVTSLTIGGLVVNAPPDVAPLRYKIVSFRMTAEGVGLWAQVILIPR